MSVVRRVVVMGVSGSGKSTLGAALAEHLGLPFLDGDDLHPAVNLAAMRAGRPLTDADREPWLDAVGGRLSGWRRGGVVACSALKRRYRDRLRAFAPEAFFAHLAGDPELLASRMSGREHFMPGSLLPSQLADLEPLGADEAGVTLDVAEPVDALVDAIVRRL